MSTATESRTPLVSMVVPVYNSVTYLAETLDSLLVQGLSDQELEVVMVDDGSDDGSEKMMDDYVARHPNFRVIHQEQSGGPASPCNEGVWAARGKYFFLLGSDDVMTPGALRELVDVAEREGSDVVLAKLGSLGGRGTPGSVYRKTVYDADPVEHKIFNTLAAVKLFRRELVDITGAFHPPHLRVGSDQPFVAALFLAAKKFSICADREYVLIRRRDDGSNITRTFRSPTEYVDLSSAVLGVIVAGTDAGPLRDGVARRTFRREIPQIVGEAFLDLTEAEQRLQMDRVREMLVPVYNDATAVHFDPRTRTKVDLMIDGDLDTLREFIEWEKAAAAAPVIHDGAAFIYSVPAELAARIGAHRLHAPAVKGETTLTGVSSAGSLVEITATAIALDCRTASSETFVRLGHRTTGAELDIPTETVRELAHPSGTGHEVRARADLGSCTGGVWDAYMVQRFAKDEIVNRLGAKKSDAVRSNPRYLFASDDDARPLGKIYYTRGPENLSIDIGFTHTRNELPEASVEGTVWLSDGSELAIVSALRIGEITFLEPGSRGGRPARTSIPFFALDEGLFAVALPRGVSHDGARRRLVVRSGSAEQNLLLPAPAEASVSDPWGSPAERRRGQRTAEIFREAVEELGVVGHRSARRAGREVTMLPRRLRGTWGRRRS
ncbi:MAG: glycosyltransferase [Brachybacterium sp.]|uniref:glycosyltransferase family 2 protein n=1 Tax=Brachybacterium sp. TaxID=1891286 RepID=UPI00264762F9|nr:glycosyltransferase [Brachybacterium sp.]MDN5687608.1 glycosyltransferase [Brachybacterium sp.]